MPILRHLLGKGSSGEVYRARVRGREVALKVLRSDHLTPLGLERFRREFEVSRQLDHPTLVKAYDMDEFAGRPCYTMDLVEGRKLVDYVAQYPQALPGLLAQLLGALDHIHSQGILHRDLKPDNVLVQADGALRLFDFGLARRACDPHLTCIGSVLGTPTYMSPEQVRGELLDVRSDLYSVGALAYEAISGKAPFGGDDIQAILYNVLYSKPPQLPALQPLPVLRLVRWLLEKRPEDRPGSAARALECLKGTTNFSQPRHQVSRRRLPFAACLALGLGVWGLVALTGAGGPHPPPSPIVVHQDHIEMGRPPG